MAQMPLAEQLGAHGRSLFARIRRFPISFGYYRGPRLMSALRKRWVHLRHPGADIRFGPGTYLGPGFRLHMPFGGTFVTGAGVELRRDFRAELAGPDARIVIGAGSSCTYGVSIQCTTSVEIGVGCVIAESATIVDGSHRFRDPDRPVLAQGYDFHPIRIDDEAAIMSKCTVIADVGRHAFVGANAVVTRPVPPFCLAAGVPARVIECFGPPAPARHPPDDPRRPPRGGPPGAPPDAPAGPPA